MVETNTEKVRDLMQTDVMTFGRNDRLADVDAAMKDRNIRHIVVLDEQHHPCGVVSQRELYRGALMRALGYGSYLTEKVLNDYVVKEAMSNEFITTTPETTVQDAARIMLDKKIGCLPVVEGKTLLGIITESDFLKSIV